MPEISEFKIGLDGKAYTEYSDGTNSVKALDSVLTTVKNAGNQTVLDDASRAAAQSSRTITLPSRAAALIASPVFVSAGRAFVGVDPKKLVPISPKCEATQYYVDFANGNDTNNGTTWALAVKSIWKATQLGNTTAVPFTVNIAAGLYPRQNAFGNDGATVTPTQHCIYRAVGGQVVCYTGNALTWVLDSGTTYSVARSNCKRILDLINFDADGDYNEIQPAASLAACRATPGTYYTDNVTIYVNRIDGAAATDANTRVLLALIPGIVATTSGSMHLYGITQMGGANGNIQIQGNTSGRFYAEDCKFYWSTNATYADNVTSLDYDLVVMNRCVAAKAQKDGFNYHLANSLAPKAIHFDCLGYGNGTAAASTSNNGATIHDAGLLIDFNGRYFKNYGGDFAHANANTLAVAVCTQTYGSYGDIARGGVANAGTGFHAIDFASIYKFDCVGNDQITSSGTITQG